MPAPTRHDDWIAATLADLRAQGLLRTLRHCGPPGVTVRVGGRELLHLASNNYLDLARHPRVIEAAREAVGAWGWGSGASQLISGFTELHEALRAALCAFEHAEDAVLFPTGYQANLGAITALADKGDVVILDKLCHASIVDGARLSGAEVRAFPHNNVARLRALLGKYPNRRVLVAVDTVYSMDGDLAPLPDLVAACTEHRALLLVDEAHATGVLGASGRGACERFGLCASGEPEGPLLRLGTLSKALGGIGGFVVGSAARCDLLRNRARAAIYTTALPPAAAAAAVAALDVVREEPERRRRVLALAGRLRRELRARGWNVPEGETPVLPLIVGAAEATLDLSRRLLEAGILAPAIRPPTVPPGTSRLRISLTAAHNERHLDRLLEALGPGPGLDPDPVGGGGPGGGPGHDPAGARR